MELPTDPANTPPSQAPPVAPTREVLPPGRPPRRPAIYAQIVICLIGVGAGWFFGRLGVFLHEGFPEPRRTANVVFAGELAGAVSGLLAALAWMRSLRSMQTGSDKSGGVGWLVLCSALAGIGAAAVTHGVLFAVEAEAHGWTDAGRNAVDIIGIGVLLFGGFVGLVAGAVSASVMGIDTTIRRRRC